MGQERKRIKSNKRIQVQSAGLELKLPDWSIPFDPTCILAPLFGVGLGRLMCTHTHPGRQHLAKDLPHATIVRVARSILFIDFFPIGRE